MIDFDYWSPTYIAFGKGKESRTGELVRRFGGHKALLHYGGGSAERMQDELDDAMCALRVAAAAIEKRVREVPHG